MSVRRKAAECFRGKSVNLLGEENFLGVRKRGCGVVFIART